MAISSFAPGAEVVKDKQLHTCLGFASYESSRGMMIATDPLGPAVFVGRCASCEALHSDSGEDSQLCRECGTQLIRQPLHEPRGFRTDFSAEDFSEPDSRGPSPSAPALAVIDQEEPERRVGPIAVRSYRQRQIFEINDNAGELFGVYAHRGTFLSPGNGRAGEKGAFGDLLAGEPDRRIAIASIRPTDVMVLELDELHLPAGPRPLTRESCRVLTSACWSFAEILRLTAADVLEIDARELEVGLQPWRTNWGLSSRVFVSDRLENGAGYAARLATVELERALYVAANRVASKWDDPAEHPDCDTSCPDCLSSYDNRRLHPQLDWRLALDMVALALGGSPSLARWTERSRVVADALADAFALESTELAGLPAIQHPGSGRSVVLGHPLWSSRDHELETQQAEARREAPGACELLDPVTADRAPDRVARLLAPG
jgi:DEAD/DEAH box helicase domain-containing protein